MNVKDFFKKIGNWLWDSLYKAWKGKEAFILNDIKRIATPVIESTLKIDFNRDGRIAAANEILDAVKQTGVEWGKAWLNAGKEKAFDDLANHYTDNDLLRWLAVARIFTSLAAKYGQQFFPKTRIINAILELVLVDSLSKKE